MALPIRTTLDDVRDLCRYLATKPTGATVAEAKSVLDKKRLDGRKVTALKFWKLIEESDAAKLKLTPSGRELAKGGDDETEVLLEIVRAVPPYSAIVERAAHRHEDSLDTTEVGAHWHDHFLAEAGDNDTTLKDRAVCFFHVASGAGLGTVIAGRKGNPTRMSFSAEALKEYLSGGGPAVTPPPEHEAEVESEAESDSEIDIDETKTEDGTDDSTPHSERPGSPELGQAIFIAHGKNKKPLDQLKKILEQFHIPYKVAVEEPNLGRPISGKVREIMHACNCAILIFTSDEEFKDKDGNTVWRPSENVVYELGATGYLYDNRIVILKEDDVDFPSNFSDIGYISFKHDQLEAKAMDVLKELISFGIVRIST
jgi:predicted nucleotide-binding protein